MKTRRIKTNVHNLSKPNKWMKLPKHFGLIFWACLVHYLARIPQVKARKPSTITQKRASRILTAKNPRMQDLLPAIWVDVGIHCRWWISATGLREEDTVGWSAGYLGSQCQDVNTLVMMGKGKERVPGDMNHRNRIGRFVQGKCHRNCSRCRWLRWCLLGLEWEGLWLLRLRAWVGWCVQRKREEMTYLERGN